MLRLQLPPLQTIDIAPASILTCPCKSCGFTAHLACDPGAPPHMISNPEVEGPAALNYRCLACRSLGPGEEPEPVHPLKSGRQYVAWLRHKDPSMDPTGPTPAAKPAAAAPTTHAAPVPSAARGGGGTKGFTGVPQYNGAAAAAAAEPTQPVPWDIARFYIQQKIDQEK